MSEETPLPESTEPSPPVPPAPPEPPAAVPEPQPEPVAEPEKKSRGGCATFFIVLLVLGALGVAGTFFAPPIVSDYLNYRLAKFKESAFTEDIEESFREDVVRIASTNGSELTVARIISDVSFDRKTAVKAFGRTVPLSENVVTVSTKATFPYHIKLDGAWELRPAWNDEHSLIVVAPMFEPTLPIAFDTEAMSSELTGWWVSRHQQGQSLDQLKVDLTRKLEARAQSEENIEAARKICRESVGQFVKDWLADKDKWQNEGFSEIKVLFPDESQKDAESLAATIRLGEEQVLAPVE